MIISEKYFNKTISQFETCNVSTFNVTAHPYELLY